MGQKVSPIGFRLVNDRKLHRSVWYAGKKEFGKLLMEDFHIRRLLNKRFDNAGVARIEIRRMSDKTEVIIHSSRPGLIIGKKGAEIEAVKTMLSTLTQKNVWVEVEEVKRPDIDAQLVAYGIAKQLEKRVAFRRAMKKALRSCLDAGALGIKVQVSGRLGGAEIARTEWYLEGQMPLHTLRAQIDYATARAETTYGCIGIKVWINRGIQFARKKEPKAKKTTQNP